MVALGGIDHLKYVIFDSHVCNHKPSLYMQSNQKSPNLKNKKNSFANEQDECHVFQDSICFFLSYSEKNIPGNSLWPFWDGENVALLNGCW